MSEIKVNSIKGVGSTDAAITINNSDGTCTANLTNRTNKNLVVNGGMIIAQRRLSQTSSTNGYRCVDRFRHTSSGLDDAPTHEQVDIAAGTTPYTLGFRKSYKLTNGNQSSGAGADDRMQTQYSIESQDIANSGWNYTSSASFITLSFWVKSSVAQNFFGFLQTDDGTSQSFPFQTGSLSADTWTKVVVKIPGNSNLQFDNNNEMGMKILWDLFEGTNKTDSSATLNQWGAFVSTAKTPDQTSTWYTTNDATFELTGVQLEVGSVATDFEHRSYGQELALCQRYCVSYLQTDNKIINIFGGSRGSNYKWFTMDLPSPMRADPTVTRVGNVRVGTYNNSYEEVTDTLTVGGVTPTVALVEPANDKLIIFYFGSISGMSNSANITYILMFTASTSGGNRLTLDAEL